MKRFRQILAYVTLVFFLSSGTGYAQAFKSQALESINRLRSEFWETHTPEEVEAAQARLQTMRDRVNSPEGKAAIERFESTRAQMISKDSYPIPKVEPPQDNVPENHLGNYMLVLEEMVAEDGALIDNHPCANISLMAYHIAKMRGEGYSLEVIRQVSTKILRDNTPSTIRWEEHQVGMYARFLDKTAERIWNQRMNPQQANLVIGRECFALESVNAE